MDNEGEMNDATVAPSLSTTNINTSSTSTASGQHYSSANVVTPARGQVVEGGANEAAVENLSVGAIAASFTPRLDNSSTIPMASTPGQESISTAFSSSSRIAEPFASNDLEVRAIPIDVLYETNFANYVKFPLPHLESMDSYEAASFLRDIPMFEKAITDSFALKKQFKANIRLLIGRSCLEILCRYNLGNVNPDTVKNEVLLNFLKELASANPAPSKARLSQALDGLCYFVSITPPASRLLTLFKDLHKKLEGAHIAEEDFKTDKDLMEKVAKKIGLILPAEVQFVIDELAIRRNHMFSGLDDLHDFLLPTIIDGARFERNWNKNTIQEIPKSAFARAMEAPPTHGKTHYVKPMMAYPRKNEATILGKRTREEIDLTKDNCFTCGMPGHHTRECATQSNKKTTKWCDLHGNCSHSTEQCYATKVKKGLAKPHPHFQKKEKAQRQNQYHRHGQQERDDAGNHQDRHISAVLDLKAASMEMMLIIDGPRGFRSSCPILVDTGAKVIIFEEKYFNSLNMPHRVVQDNGTILFGVDGTPISVMKRVLFERVSLQVGSETKLVGESLFYICKDVAVPAILGMETLSGQGISAATILKMMSTTDNMVASLFDSTKGKIDNASNLSDEDLFARVKSVDADLFNKMFPEHDELSATSKQTANYFVRLWQSESINVLPPPLADEVVIELIPGAPPNVKQRVRSYSPDQLNAMKANIDQLVKDGMIYPNKNARYVSPVLMVRKGSGWRMVADFTLINSYIVKVCWPMTLLEQAMHSNPEAEWFAKLDLAQGYYHIPLAAGSKDILSIITPFGVFTPNRMLQGFCNATFYFQYVMGKVLHAFRDYIIIYIDDILILKKTQQQLFQLSRDIVDTLQKAGFHINFPKSTFGARKLTFCGMTISKDGVTTAMETVRTLTSLPEPSNLAELAHIVHSAQWCKRGVIHFAELIAPLQNLMNSFKEKKTSRAKKVHLGNKWTAEHLFAYEHLKKALIGQCVISHRKMDHALIMATDASDLFWSGIIAQVPQDQKTLPVDKQGVELLAITSGQFRASEKNWPIEQKEAAAIIQTCKRYRPLLLGAKEIIAYTDNRNLSFILREGNPIGATAQANDRISRWRLYLQDFPLKVVPISSEDNAFCDMLTRWAHPIGAETRSTPASADPSISSASSVVTVVENQDVDHGDFPSDYELKKADAVRKQDGTWYLSEPNDYLKIRIITVAHGGWHCHPGVHATCKIIQEWATWENMEDDVSKFVKACLICNATNPTTKFVRPMGHMLSPFGPNDIITLDFLYIGASFSGEKYLLVMMDNFSQYSRLVPTKAADSQIVAKALQQWTADFGAPRILITDGGSHFENELIQECAKLQGIDPKVTHAYAPYTHGNVERVNRSVLDALRCITLEYKAQFKDWPSFVCVVQSALNTTSRQDLGSTSALMVFTGLSLRRSANLALETKNAKGPLVVSPDVITKQINTLKDLQQERCLKVKQAKLSKQLRNEKNYNKKAHSLALRVGDFVMVARGAPSPHKLQNQWMGPYQVEAFPSPQTVKVQSLLNRGISEVHSCRVRFYSDAAVGLKIGVPLLEEIEYNSTGFYMDKLVDFRKTRYRDIEALVGWRGVEEAHNQWLPLAEVIHRNSELITDFFKMNPTHALRKAVEQAKL
jgi:hypothetical protein